MSRSSRQKTKQPAGERRSESRREIKKANMGAMDKLKARRRGLLSHRRLRYSIKTLISLLSLDLDSEWILYEFSGSELIHSKYMATGLLWNQVTGLLWTVSLAPSETHSRKRKFWFPRMKRGPKPILEQARVLVTLDGTVSAVTVRDCSGSCLVKETGHSSQTQQ